MHNSLHFPNCDLDIHLCGKVAKQIEMSLEDCVRQRHPECSYQVGFQDKGEHGDELVDEGESGQRCLWRLEGCAFFFPESCQDEVIMACFDEKFPTYFLK